MNNEEKILAMLGQMIERQDKTDQAIHAMHEELGQVRVELGQLREDQGEMREELGQVREELGQLREDQVQMREEMNERFDTLEASLKYAWEDIATVEKRVIQHEKEFHKVG